MNISCLFGTKLSCITFLLFWAGISQAAIIHYEVSGTMDLADPNWNNITSHAISGYMLVSDVGAFPYPSYFDVDIESFVIRAGGYEWSGTGRIYGGSDRNIHLDGPGDWDLVNAIVAASWGALPATISWGGFEWHFGDELFSRVVSLNMQAVSIPAAVWLFCSGLVGLIGLARRNNI